jgi:hypothetical protein
MVIYQAHVQAVRAHIPEAARSTALVVVPESSSYEGDSSSQRDSSKKRKVTADPTPTLVASSPAGQTEHAHDRLLEIAQELQHPMSSLQRNMLQTELAQLEGQPLVRADAEYREPSSDSSSNSDLHMNGNLN